MNKYRKVLLEKIDNLEHRNNELSSSIDLLHTEFETVKIQNEQLIDILNRFDNKLTNNGVELEKARLSLSNQNSNMSNQICKISRTLEFNNTILEPHNTTSNGKSNILIVGFYGADNLGDELMLQTIVKYLDLNKLNVTIMIAENSMYEPYITPNVNYVFYPSNLLELNKIANEYDGVIFGGGALIDDTDFEKKDCSNLTLSKILIHLSELMISSSKKVLWLGLSTNSEIENKEFIYRLNNIVEHASIYIRDTNSINTLKRCGVNIKKIELIDDIIFANDFNVDCKTKKGSIFNIGIVLICNQELYDENLKLVKNIVTYSNKHIKEYSINLIPFYNYNKIDFNYLKRIKEDVRNKNTKINVLNYTNNFENVKSNFINQDIVISMRYHGALLACIYRKPLLSVVLNSHRHYKNKFSYLLSNYSILDSFINFGDKLSEDKFVELINQKKNKDLSSIINKSSKDISNILKDFIK